MGRGTASAARSLEAAWRSCSKDEEGHKTKMSIAKDCKPKPSHPPLCPSLPDKARWITKTHSRPRGMATARWSPSGAIYPAVEATILTGSRRPISAQRSSASRWGSSNTRGDAPAPRGIQGAAERYLQGHVRGDGIGPRRRSARARAAMARNVTSFDGARAAAVLVFSALNARTAYRRTPAWAPEGCPACCARRGWTLFQESGLLAHRNPATSSVWITTAR